MKGQGTALVGAMYHIGFFPDILYNRKTENHMTSS